MGNVIVNDDYGNEIEFSELEDGRIKMVTRTNKSKEFEFLNDLYQFKILFGASTIKNYSESRHEQSSLVCDKYGRLFYYRYEEDMNFNGGPDREDESWTLVENEADADSLSALGKWSALRVPFVCTDESGWMAAHEYVESLK